MTDEQFVEEYTAAKKKMKELRAEFKRSGKNLFKKQAKQLFDSNPKLKSFGWNQYTPYWNDGDPCTFRVSRDPYVNGYNSAYEDGEVDTTTTEKEYEQLQDKVVKFMSMFLDDDFLLLFGDHVTVTVTPKGITTDHYSHE